MLLVVASPLFEWELSAAQELSEFIFGLNITQFKDDKAQTVCD